LWMIGEAVGATGSRPIYLVCFEAGAYVSNSPPPPIKHACPGQPTDWVVHCAILYIRM
jgi:hypothetical protein